MKRRVYLDNAATTPIDSGVLETMLPFLTQFYGNPSSSHEEGRIARAAVEKSRRLISKMIGAGNLEVFFTSGGTEANNTILKGAVRDLGVRRILISTIEHACVKNASLSLERDCQIELDFIKVNTEGTLDLLHLENLLSSSDLKTLVSVMHSNNEIGTMQDLEQISALCKKYQALFHTDTVQTFGYYPTPVNRYPIDFMSGSAHKLHGPKGIGFMYVNKSLHIHPLIDGGGQERLLRSGTENVAGIVGFGKAVELFQENGSSYLQQIQDLKKYFAGQLKEKFGNKVSFNGSLENSHAKVLSVNFDIPIANDMFLFRLDLEGIAVSGGSACSSGANKGSAVLQAIALPNHLKTVRFSFSHSNIIEELDYTIAVIQKIID
jgi:cysteine desulfurase